MTKKYYFDLKMTKYDFKSIIEELNQLKTVEAIFLQEQLKKARRNGDLKNNETYQLLRNQMTEVYDRIALLEDILEKNSLKDLN